MKDLFINLLQSDAFWFFIHAAFAVTLTNLAVKYLSIAGTFLNIPVKQLTSWFVAIVIGIVGHYIGIGALTEKSVVVVMIYSFLAGLGGNGVYDAVRKK